MAIAAMRVPTIFYAVDRFSDVVSRMSARTAAFGQTAEAAAMRTSRGFNKAGTNMLTAGVGIAAGIGLAVNEAAKFEKSMANISTTIDSTPESMKKMGDAILKISQDIPVSIADLTSGMYDVVSVGILGTANQLDVLEKSSLLAVAGLGTVKEGVDITTSSINAFGVEAGTASEVTNKLFKAVKYGKTTVAGISESFGAFAAIMKNSGVTLDEYLASAAALTTTGMSMSRAQTQVSSATIALIKPNKTMSAVYKKLGVTDVPLFIKKSGGLVGALDAVNTQATSMGISMAKVMGRKEGLSALLSLLGAQKGKFAEIMKDMASGTDVLGEAFAKQQATLSAKLQRMKNDMTVLAIRIGEVLIPRIQGLLNSVIPTIEGITRWSQQNKGFANTLMTVAKWLLILGITAKVGAFLFYGVSKAIAVCSAVTSAYTFISSMAALANVGFGTALWGVVTAMWAFVVAEAAILAPLLLVIGALGLLTYAFWETGDSTESMVNKQVASLSKGNMAWINSTKTMEGQLKKQNSLNSTAATITPLGAPRTMNVGMAKTWGAKKADEMSRAVKENATMPVGQRYTPEGLKYAVNKGLYKFKKEGENAPTNMAGSNNDDAVMGRLAAFAQKQKLDIRVFAPDGYGATAESPDIKGITVKTKNNQGTRD